MTAQAQVDLWFGVASNELVALNLERKLRGCFVAW